MSLRIYTEPIETGSISTFDDTEYKPVSFTFDIKKGGTLQRRLWIRNDDSKVYYKSIKLTAIDTNKIGSVVTGSLNRQDFAVKLITGDKKPLEADWRATSKGNTISLADLGKSTRSDVVSYLPFWIRIEVPTNTQVDTVKTVHFKLTATAGWIG